jgi:hypothetical protein
MARDVPMDDLVRRKPPERVRGGGAKPADGLAASTPFNLKGNLAVDKL